MPRFIPAERAGGFTPLDPQQGGWGDVVGSGVDSYQAGLYGFGEAIADTMHATGVRDAMRDRRLDNEQDAEQGMERARRGGITTERKDINSLGDAAQWVGVLGAQSAPYALEAAAGGLAARSLTTAGRALKAAEGGYKAAQATGDAAQIARATDTLESARRAANVVSTEGAVAASYPSSVGDILGNQREQGGKTDLESAMLLGVPYAAMNAFGLEGAMARGRLARSGIKALDELQGVKGGFARAGATGAINAVSEGASETGQEFMNQAGRMSVDSNETFFNDKSNERFKESFIGGAALGGVFGAAGGGWRRSEGYAPRSTGVGQPRPVEENGDLLNPGKGTEQDLTLAPRGEPFNPARPAGMKPTDRTDFTDFTTSPGAADTHGGIDYNIDPSTQGLNIGQTVAARNNLIDPNTPQYDTGNLELAGREQQQGYQPPAVEFTPHPSDLTLDENTSTSPGAAAPTNGVPFRPAFNTGNLELAPQSPLPASPAPVAPNINTDALSVQQPGQPPISANTRSPKGQALQGFVENLMQEGHMDEGTHTQVSTLIAEGKFAAAKKIVDAAVKDKTAADAMLAKANAIAQKEQANAKPSTTAPAVSSVGGDETVRAGDAGADRAGEQNARPADPDVSGDQQPNLADGAVESTAGKPTATVSDDALIDAVENAKDHSSYTAAMDALYKRYMEGDESEVLEQYMDDNIGTNPSRRAFTNDWHEAERRYDEKAREGKRGLRMGGQEPATTMDPEVEAALRGTAMKFNSESGETESVLKAATARNPDTKESENPLTQSFKTGVEAATWLAANAKEAFIREIMKRILPSLGKTEIHVLEIGDKAPGPVIEQLNGTARAVTLQQFDANASQSIWVRGFDGNTEEVMAHELVHAATMDKLHLKVNAVKLKALAQVVAASLREQARQNFDADAEAMQFYESMFVRNGSADADELLAYGFTAPTFQRLMKNIDENGQWMGDPEFEQTKTVPKLTMWQKFVDTIRGFFNLPKVYSNAIEKIVQGNAEIEARNAAEAARPTLKDTLLKLYDELGGAEKASEYVARNSGAGPTASNSDSAVRDADAPVVKANSTAATAVSSAFANSAVGKTALGEKIRAALFNLKESPWALKWTTNDQIAEGYSHLKGLQQINRATGRMARVANQYLETAVNTAKKWRALPESEALAMQKLMLETTMDQMHVSIKQDGRYLSADEAFKHSSNNHLERTPEQRVAFGRHHAAFGRLSSQARTVYDTVRDDLAKQHGDTVAALRGSVAQTYASQLKRILSVDEMNKLAESSGDVRAAFDAVAQVAATPAELRVLNHMRQALKDVNEDFGRINGPYFPLVRFGDHVVVMRSSGVTLKQDEVAAARASLEKAMEDAAGVLPEHQESAQAKVDTARAEYKERLAELNKMKQNSKDYQVEFHETPYEAEKSLRAMKAANPEADIYRSVREDYYRGLDGASPAFLSDMQKTLAAALDTGDGVNADTKSKTLAALKDMYLRRQPERSALRNELRRQTIDGVKADQMLRGYAQTARNGGWRISRLMHGTEVTQGLNQLAADNRSPDSRYVLNEMKARFMGDYVMPSDSKLLQGIGNATYFMHLGFNLSYYLTNATQAWITSLPVMAGRHGTFQSSSALVEASKDVVRVLKDATVQSIKDNGKLVGIQLRLSDDQIASMGKTPGEVEMLRNLTDDGVIDITIKHDLGAVTDGTGGNLSKIMEVSSALANYPELYNRLSTALAAYRMEIGRGETQERATDYAEHIINRTHFNYSPENAPRVMRGNVGRMVFQFKRYQQGMIYLFASLAKKAWNGDAEATKSMAYLLGMNIAVGGVVALPVAAPIALAAKIVASMYPDDDEPEFMQQWYNGMKDGIGETAAQAMVKGLPTLLGLDLSKKLGAGDILNPIAFAKTQGMKTFSRDYFKEVAFALGGAGMAKVGDAFDTAGYAMDGKFAKAAESGMPTFMANALRAYNQSTEGITTKRGDTLMDPSEFGIGDAIAKAAGFSGAKVGDMYDQRAAFLNMTEGRRDARKALLADYYQAIRTGDGIAEAKGAINEFNARQKSDPIKGADIASSLKAHKRQEAETKGGLRVRKNDQQDYRELTGE